MVLSACQNLLPAPEYDYSQPVPESEQREDGWLDGSAVIGHSLMEGFEGFSNVEASIHYFTSTGLSTVRAVTYSQFDLPGGGSGTLEDGLKQADFRKVYLMLGINEIVTSQDRFKEAMTAVIALIRDNQPEGIPIYILNITPTTRAKSDSSDYNLGNIQRLNEAIAELCEEQKCYLVDLFACFADPAGYLPPELSTDGVHLTAPQYRVMADYILSHTAGEQ